jgi:hypothetical protein
LVRNYTSKPYFSKISQNFLSRKSENLLQKKKHCSKVLCFVFEHTHILTQKIHLSADGVFQWSHEGLPPFESLYCFYIGKGLLPWVSTNFHAYTYARATTFKAMNLELGEALCSRPSPKPKLGTESAHTAMSSTF